MHSYYAQWRSARWFNLSASARGKSGAGQVTRSNPSPIIRRPPAGDACGRVNGRGQPKRNIVQDTG